MKIYFPFIKFQANNRDELIKTLNKEEMNLKDSQINQGRGQEIFN